MLLSHGSDTRACCVLMGFQFDCLLLCAHFIYTHICPVIKLCIDSVRKSLY